MTLGNSVATAIARAKILVVEDEILVFFVVEDELRKIGFREVLHASRPAHALALLDREQPTLAMLDVNLAGEYVYPVADRLAAGNVPFFFATGYDRAEIPQRFADRPVLQKPIMSWSLRSTITGILQGL